MLKILTSYIENIADSIGMSIFDMAYKKIDYLKEFFRYIHIVI